MRTETGEILDESCDAILVPSSGYVVFNGSHKEAFFDDGMSKNVANLYPQIRVKLADKIEKEGNYVFVLTANTESGFCYRPFTSGSLSPPYHLINFPVKPSRVFLDEYKDKILPRYKKKIIDSKKIPGYMVEPCKGIIEESLKEVLELVNKTKWVKILVPAFQQEDVNIYISSILDDRFVLVRQT